MSSRSQEAKASSAIVVISFAVLTISAVRPAPGEQQHWEQRQVPAAFEVSSPPVRKPLGRVQPQCPEPGVNQPASLDGVVLDRDGSPLSQIVIIDLDSFNTVITNPDGLFEFPDLTSGITRLYVYHQVHGWPAVLMDVTVAPGRNLIRIPLPLPEGGFIFGRVWDECRGTPVPGATVELFAPRTTTTDSHGLFILDACCNTLGNIYVSAPGYQAIEVPLGSASMMRRCGLKFPCVRSAHRGGRIERTQFSHRRGQRWLRPGSASLKPTTSV